MVQKDMMDPLHNVSGTQRAQDSFPGFELGSPLLRGRRPKLLVSVRDANEAEVAIQAGAEWVDIKEPLRGPLGRADIDTIQHIVHAVDKRTPVSAALGELNDITPNLASRIAGIRGVHLVKIGLAGIATEPEYSSRWFNFLDAVGEFAAVAAVAYADWHIANAPRPETIIHLAATRCQALLLDTFDKGGQALPELMTTVQIKHLLTIAREQNMATVIAGRLTLASIADVLPAEPDFIAVRGAVCYQSRAGALSAERIRELREILDRM